jgi:hypothetical protein
VLRHIRGRRYCKTLDTGSKYALKKERERLEEEGKYDGYLLCVEKIAN